MKMVYDEQYGTLSHAQRAAYRKYNVSPADHDVLVMHFGEDPATLTKIVKDNSPKGQFLIYQVLTSRQYFAI